MMSLSYGREKTIEVDKKWHGFWGFVSDLETMYTKDFKFLCRIEASKPFMLGNVWFTNSTKKLVYGRTTTHKVKVGDIKMTTSQIQKELSLKGIDFNQQTLTNKAAKKENLIEKNKHKLYEYKGKLCSLKTISKAENVPYHSLKYFNGSVPLEEMIKRSRESKKSLIYEYDGKVFNQRQLAKYLQEKNPQLKIDGIRNRLKKGLSIDDCLKPFREV